MFCHFVFTAFVLKVADATSKQCLVRYSIPVQYITPFHHYHCELVMVSLIIVIMCLMNVFERINKVDISNLSLMHMSLLEVRHVRPLYS